MPPTAWLVRAGHGAEHVDAFVRGGFVSLGWARIAGLDDLREHDDEHMLALLRSAGRGQPKEDLRELTDFRDRIQVGDVVVTADTPRRDLLFGDVVGDYEFAPRPIVGDHRHFRRVTWFGRWGRDLVEDLVGAETRHYQRTVLELPNQAQWLDVAERARAGAGESVDAPQRRHGARSWAASGSQPSRVCATCGLTRSPSMFSADGDVCLDCE